MICVKCLLALYLGGYLVFASSLASPTWAYFQISIPIMISTGKPMTNHSILTNQLKPKLPPVANSAKAPKITPTANRMRILEPNFQAPYFLPKSLLKRGFKNLSLGFVF